MFHRLAFTIVFYVLFLASFFPVAGEEYSPVKGGIEPYDLRLEFLSQPRGIDEPKPRFSWKLRSEINGQAQSAYRLLVSQIKRDASGKPVPKETVWDTGKIEDTSQLVSYTGPSLLPKSEYAWNLTVWDVAAGPSPGNRPSVSVTASFSTGMFSTEKEPDPWQGQWIGLDEFSMEETGHETKVLSLEPASWIWTSPDAHVSAPVGNAVFRKKFSLPNTSPLIKAELAFAADNSYIAYLNGTKLGSGGNYRSAQLFDVATLLKRDGNVLAVKASNLGDSPNPAGLLGLLHVQFEDGTEWILVTDATWKAASGAPEQFESPQWDDSQWNNAFKLADWGGCFWGKTTVTIPEPSPPARELVKEFQVRERPVRATAYLSGLGYYECRLNDQKIGDHLLDPILTDYEKRVPYVTYDLDPDLFRHGSKGRSENLIQVTLGNGRYFAPRTTQPMPTKTYGYPKLLFQLEIEYADGTVQAVLSDESWRLSTDGPIRDNNDYDGEIYDARKSRSGQSEPARRVDAPKGKLVAQMMPPMRAVERFEPLSCTEVRPGIWIFDFGVNLVGNCTLRIPPKLPEGATLRLRHAETLVEEGLERGMLYVDNLREAKCRDIYIASGHEAEGEAYSPTFTYHGFRYAELTGLPEGIRPDRKTLTARAINTDLPRIGKFRTDNPMINAVYRNVVRGTQGNYLSIPTDCPQRDERHGWQGDRAGESKGEMMFFDNITLYSKWLYDIEDSQLENGNLSDVCPNYWSLYSPNVTWPSALIIIPDSLYTIYGDRRPIERHYRAMRRWLIDFMGSYVVEGLIDKDNYGDWCVPPESPELIHSTDPARKTSRTILATAYYIHDLDLLARYARMLGLEDEANEYVLKATEMRQAFNKRFLDRETGKYDNGTQTSCILPLYFDLVPDGLEDRVFATLANNIETVTNYHVGTGLIGGQWLNRVLTEYGRADISYRFATNTTYPSWGYMVKRGATTIWELWNGDTADPAMNSGNHVMLVGDLVIWFYQSLAGIQADPERPGFEHVLMKPVPVGDLNEVEAEYDSVRGPIRSRWKRTGNAFRWEIHLPPGTTATVHVPNGKVLENVPSGKHVFESILP